MRGGTACVGIGSMLYVILFFIAIRNPTDERYITPEAPVPDAI
jgi:hypothetical protein